VKNLLDQIITNLNTILDRLLDGLLQVLGNGDTGLLGSVNDLLNSVVSSLGDVLGSVGQVVSGLTDNLGIGKVRIFLFRKNLINYFSVRLASSNRVKKRIF
jgi:hypothetical protein